MEKLGSPQARSPQSPPSKNQPPPDQPATAQLPKPRSPRNRTLSLSAQEKARLQERIATATRPLALPEILNRTFNGNTLEALPLFPEQSVDLMIIDPPYNLSKNFNGLAFKAAPEREYIAYLESWFPHAIRLLKEGASLYICGDWKCASALQGLVSKYLVLRNRITWQREKGRGATSNWKNCSEDIWFATVSNKYYFDVHAVKMKRRVLAPYRENGRAKGWEAGPNGNFRLTHPSNFWDDITIPYWSMPENTDHPTQKPEKLIAKLVLASCPAGGLVFDPFLGSGTTSVVAKKLGRSYCGIELNREYCLWAEKRLEQADENSAIQGYTGGVFWERNSGQVQKSAGKNQ